MQKSRYMASILFHIDYAYRVSRKIFWELFRILGQKYIIWVHFPEYTYARDTHGAVMSFFQIRNSKFSVVVIVLVVSVAPDSLKTSYTYLERAQ